MNVDPEYHTKLLELRSMKDFAAICQFMHSFHTAFALEDFETEDLEQALVDPSSLAYLVDLQARMLRALTQDRRISFDNWIKFAQKEFEKRAVDGNPWLEEDATNYEDFSLETKLMILGSLCEWQLDDPERFRSNFKEEEELAVEWRVDPIGHDARDRTYWLFDDNRLYRENPPHKNNAKTSKQAPPPPKTTSVPSPRRGTRRSTRGQKTDDSPEPELESEFETPPITPGVAWEPVCITKHEWEEFSKLFRRSKHPDEKALHKFVNNDILPKVLGDFKEKEKEREKLEAIANRKRSSRIVVKEFELQEKARLEAIRQQELQAALEQRKQELRERRAERERQQQQQVRDNRLKEREKRLKDREEAIWEREEKKKQQQQKIAKEREERKKRRLAGGHHDDHSEDEATNQQDEDEEEDWVFDCVCGVHGNNLDDGELMIACGKCNVWQHVACLKQEDAAQGKKVMDWATVDFTCPRCIAKEQKKVARKEKREQKLRLEAMANGTGSNGASNPPNDVKKEVKRKKQTASPQTPKGHNLPHTNGHYMHPPTHHNSITSISQSHVPYPVQSFPTQPQPYPSPASYHQSPGIVSASQTYYGGHSSGHPGQPQPHYPYQPAPQPLQQQQHHYLLSPHQQPQQYRQPYQQPQSPSTHYGSHGVSQSYPNYSASPMNSVLPSQVPYNQHPIAAQHQEHQLQGDYSASRPQQPYLNKVEAYPQQYKTDTPTYGQVQTPSGSAFAGQGGSAAVTVQKRVNPVEDTMEGVERPPKMMNNHRP
ncbi:hypothetical protein EDD21DRAFT_138530 [Dissophora ornata]|nr:hypothetical protein BGZ58_005534 [Dissophora ornata]KAI8605467.1 hypothetical protein EDD21DRAFT_138530 [Dissophora ornata]